MAGPYGTYVLEHARSLGRPQRQALQELFSVCGAMWAKEVRRDDLPALFQRVVRAVCAVERHLPVSELDVKLHNLLHLVEGIADMGG